MNYPEELKVRYNEVMYEERDIIQNFLLQRRCDLRYGSQRDTWHFEPAVELVAHQGSLVLLHDIKLDKDNVVFCVEAFCEKNAEWESYDFAYGELSKVIDALPDAKEIMIKNAIADISCLCKDCSIVLDDPFKAFIKGDAVSINTVSVVDGSIKAYNCIGVEFPVDKTDTGLVLGLRNYINIEVLHRYNEYKKLIDFLSTQPNLRYEPDLCLWDVITIHGTNTKVCFLSASLDSNKRLQLCVDDGQETILLEEKDIYPEYLVALVGYIKDHLYGDIMDTYNGHSNELVRKINDAWKSEKYHDLFGDILFALGCRDKQEIQDKFDIVIDCNETAMDNAHEIMECVCDDLDLETILSFIRYEG